MSTNARVLTTPTAAITAEDVDLTLGDGASGWVSSDRFGTVRVRATGTDGTPVFLGIAPQAAVDSWLAGVAHDQVSDIADNRVTYLRTGGTAAAPAPTTQTFWSTSVSGSGTQELHVADPHRALGSGARPPRRQPRRPGARRRRRRHPVAHRSLRPGC